MAEGRMIKKEIRRSEKMAKLSNDKARVLYFMIYPHADVEGRLSGNPVDIIAECVPLFRWSVKIIEKALYDLHSIGLIIWYEVDSKRWIQIVRFREFQRLQIDRESKSSIPSYSEHNSGVLMSTLEGSGEIALSKVKLSKDKLSKDNKEERGGFAPPSFEDLSKYCQERGNAVDPRMFLDFYEAKGWMIGKNKMRDWRAAVRTWEQRGGRGKKYPQIQSDETDKKIEEWEKEPRFEGTK